MSHNFNILASTKLITNSFISSRCKLVLKNLSRLIYKYGLLIPGDSLPPQS